MDTLYYHKRGRLTRLAHCMGEVRDPSLEEECPGMRDPETVAVKAGVLLIYGVLFII